MMFNVYFAFVQRVALAALFMLAPLLAQAQTQSPEEMIRDNIESFMSQIDGKKEYYANNLDELKALVNESLDDVADFRYIGASVMGSYFRNATPEQRSRFADVFRQTLIDKEGFTQVSAAERRAGRHR